MMLLLIVVLLTLGLGLLSMTLRYPYTKLFSTKPNPNTLYAFRITAWSLLAESFALSLYIYSLGIGFFLWFGLLSATSLFLTLLYSYLPKHIFLGVKIDKKCN